jgi:hypothetical protein
MAIGCDRCKEKEADYWLGSNIMGEGINQMSIYLCPDCYDLVRFTIQDIIMFKKKEV